VTARQQWSVVAAIIVVLGGALFVASRMLGDQLYPVSVGSKAPEFRAATVDSVPRTQTLADYGLKPPKAKTPQTSEQKAKAAAKLRATRIARGTTSKKQKAKIHGVVTATTGTPAAPPTPPGPKPAT